MARTSSPIPSYRYTRDGGGSFIVLLVLIAFILYALISGTIAHYLLILRVAIWIVSIVLIPVTCAGGYFLAMALMRQRSQQMRCGHRAAVLMGSIGGTALGAGLAYVLTLLLVHLVDPYATIIHAKWKVAPSSLIVGSLAHMLQSHDDEVRALSAKGWVHFVNTSVDAEAALSSLLADPIEQVRVAAVGEMNRLSNVSPTLRTRLIPTVVDKTASVRHQAVLTLDRLDRNWPRTQQARTILPQMAFLAFVDRDAVIEKRLPTIDARWPESAEAAQVAKLVSPVIANYLLPDSKRVDAMMLAERLGPRAGELVPLLIAALASESGKIRIHAIRLLGTIGPIAQTALPVLYRIKADGHEDAAEAQRVIETLERKTDQIKPS